MRIGWLAAGLGVFMILLRSVYDTIQREAVCTPRCSATVWAILTAAAAAAAAGAGRVTMLLSM
jgi:hypothetical protein